jgi:hypothetical protein
MLAPYGRIRAHPGRHTKVTIRPYPDGNGYNRLILRAFQAQKCRIATAQCYLCGSAGDAARWVHVAYAVSASACAARYMA